MTNQVVFVNVLYLCISPIQFIYQCYNPMLPTSDEMAWRVNISTTGVRTKGSENDNSLARILFAALQHLK